MKSSVLEVAIETPKDGNVYFSPFGASLRGRKDYMRVARHHADAIKFANAFPRGVPGTIVQVDFDAGSVSLVEPLRDAEWLSEREELESRGIKIPQTISFNHSHLPDWLHEIKRAIDAGYATIVKGELPKDLGKEKEGPKSAEDKSEDQFAQLVETVKSQNEMIEKLLRSLTGAK